MNIFVSALMEFSRNNHEFYLYLKISQSFFYCLIFAVIQHQMERCHILGENSN